MNKQELITAISESVGESKACVDRVISALGEIASDSLSQGDDVALPGLGKLKVTHRAAREGRNPKTGEAVSIPSRRAVKFSASSALTASIN